MNAGFLLDLNRCTGCDACRLACEIENRLEAGSSWRQVLTFNEERHPAAPLFHLSLACNHCGNAPCIRACPANAIGLDDSSGAVLIDGKRCIGCRYCSWACPYEAPRLCERQSVMTKCTFCNHRLAEGKEPACVSLCPTGALRRAPAASSAGVPEVPGFHVDGHEPQISFIPPRRGYRAPEMTSEPEGAKAGAELPGRTTTDGGISLRGEWPLVAFALIAAALAGWTAAALFCGISISAPVFIVLAGVAVAVSGAHLGRIGRSWRAVLNLRKSWLSREVALYGLFAGLASAWLLLLPGSHAAGWATLAVAAAFLLAADRIYDVARKEIPAHFHSAGAIWMGLYFGSVLSGSLTTLSVVAALKAVLYAVRKVRMCRRGRRVRLSLSVTRVSIGLLAPPVVALLWPPEAWFAALCAAAVGEIIDRSEYYLELRIETPRQRLRDALEEAIGAGGLSAT